MKNTLKVIRRKYLGWWPSALALVTLICTTLVLLPVLNYVSIRTSIRLLEEDAYRSGYLVEGEFKANWSETRIQAYEKLEADMQNLTNTSCIAKLCSTFATTNLYRLGRDIVIIAIGIAWLLSIKWFAYFIRCGLYGRIYEYKRAKRMARALARVTEEKTELTETKKD